MKKIIYVLMTLCILVVGHVSAQNQTSSRNPNFFNTNMEYGVEARFSIGGSSPLGFPREIRKIESYNPGLQVGLEANATKWLESEQKWGVRLGLRFETKGMKTRARVKNYLTEVVQGNSKVQGYYTGVVQTNVQNTYITLPVSAVYKVSAKWNLYGGLYFSRLLDNTFNGYVADGYLRQDTPTGTKITFEEGSSAPYDFSDEVRTSQWGTQIGAVWKMNQHFSVLADLSYGFNDLLKKDFNSIDFSMHNIYLNIGFGYNF